MFAKNKTTKELAAEATQAKESGAAPIEPTLREFMATVETALQAMAARIMALEGAAEAPVEGAAQEAPAPKESGSLKKRVDSLENMMGKVVVDLNHLSHRPQALTVNKKES